MGACRKRRPNLACAAFPRQPINQKWAYMSKTTVQFYVHTTCRGESSYSHVCTTSIDTDTPKTTARFDVQHISNRSDVSRVLSLTAAADAHMQSWIAVMLDRKREKTAVRFDVHISETKTRPCSRLWLPCQKRWSILACACFSYFFPSSFFIFFILHSSSRNEIRRSESLLHGTAETSTTTTMPLFFEAGEHREVSPYPLRRRPLLMAALSMPQPQKEEAHTSPIKESSTESHY